MSKSPSEDSDKSLPWSEFISQCEELNEISESLKSILLPHFESHIIGKVKEFIKGWQCDEKPDHRNTLLQAFYVVANKSHKECGDFLKENYNHRGDSPIEGEATGLELSARIFNVISKQCSGEISRSDITAEDSDPVWHQCRRISDESNDDLAKKIGIFFRICLDRYLQEEFKDIYNDVANSSDSRSFSQADDKRPSSAPSGTIRQTFGRADSKCSAVSN